MDRGRRYGDKGVGDGGKGGGRLGKSGQGRKILEAVII